MMFDKAPPGFREAIEAVRLSEQTRGINTFKGRKSEFRSREAACLAGISVDRTARKKFDGYIDEMWARNILNDYVYPEVVIGGGLHAAIYSSVRVAEGQPRPLVLEASSRVGGVFAVTKEASFFLNSRNRPGSLGLPGQASALNVIPGGPVQPADLSGDEYQRNSDLAFCIRAALACHANVLPKRFVSGIRGTEGTPGTYDIELEDGTTISTLRIVIATGLGVEKSSGFGVNSRVQTYIEFLQRLDTDFPLRGVGRAAVVGAGDSGKTVVEALLGQGPQMGYSVASLDYVERIDWYGVPATCLTRETWEANNRSRYKPLARLLPRVGGRGSFRVQPMTERADSIALGYESAYVNERPYDLVVTCIGFEPNMAVEMPRSWNLDNCIRGGRVVARRVFDEDDSGSFREVYVVGPAAQIDVSDGEARSSEALSLVPENSTALFRYADRTATLAKSFSSSDISVNVKITKANDDPRMEGALDKNGRQLEVGDIVLTADSSSTDLRLGNNLSRRSFRERRIIGRYTADGKIDGSLANPTIVVSGPGPQFLVSADNYKTVDGKFGEGILFSADTVYFRDGNAKYLDISDADGVPIFAGSIVKPVEDNDESLNDNEEFTVLGLATEGRGVIVLDYPGGYACTNSEGKLVRGKFGIVASQVIVQN